MITTPLGYIVGRVYNNHELFSSTQSSSAALQQNAVVYTPIFIYQDVVIDALIINCSTAGSNAIVDFGLYSNVSGVPGSLIVDAGSADLSTKGNKLNVIPATTLKAGWYWGAISATTWTTAPSITTGGGTYALTSLLGTRAGYASGAVAAYVEPSNALSLPPSSGVSNPPSPSEEVFAQAPMMWYRVSSVV